MLRFSWRLDVKVYRLEMNGKEVLDVSAR